MCDHNVRIYAQLFINSDRDNLQSQLTRVLHYLARFLLIFSNHHRLANPRSTPTQQRNRFTRASNIRCSIITVNRPGTPIICAYCDILRHIIPQKKRVPHFIIATSSTTICCACVIQDSPIATPLI